MSSVTGCFITGTGACLPSRVVANAELAPQLGVTSEWIEANSGIHERRWVAAEQSTSDLAVAAVRDALDDASLSSDQVDYLIGCSLSPDYQVPGIAALVQRKLEGCRQVPALDIRAGCAGIVYSLQLARGLIESGAARNVVCFGAEAQSKGLDLNPRSAELSMLFGDGAGAIVVSGTQDSASDSQEPRLRIEDILIESDGRFAEDLIVRAPGTGNGARWIDSEQIAAGLQYGSMQGRSVILQAVRKLADAAVRITERNSLSLGEIEVVIPHQANANLLRALAKKLSMPEECIVTNVEQFGNTSGASAFLAFWQAKREHRFRADANVLILAFGAGFTWGAALCRVCYV
ncbi:MAG TPA: ketoacyl-ACP synthase III [Blastocatellia bacterium]|nr:ketoacyl-ACP synthase III [Blastocatellia bacterium]